MRWIKALLETGKLIYIVDIMTQNYVFTNIAHFCFRSHVLCSIWLIIYKAIYFIGSYNRQLQFSTIHNFTVHIKFIHFGLISLKGITRSIVNFSFVTALVHLSKLGCDRAASSFILIRDDYAPSNGTNSQTNDSWLSAMSRIWNN